MPDRLAVSTNSYHSYSLEEALAGIAAAGFSSVELSSVPGWTEHVLRDAGAAELARIAGLVTHYGLDPISLSGHSDLASEAGKIDFRKALGIARTLGIRYVTTSTGGHDASSEGTVEEQRAAFLKLIRPLADEAAADGIQICLETHGGVSATGEMAAVLVQEIDRPNVGINYDTANVIFYGKVRPETDIVHAAPYINHLHIKDQIGGPGVWNFPAIGTGEVDFMPIFAALSKTDFAGPCSIEIEFQGEPWPPLADVESALTTSREFLRHYLPEQDLGGNA
ncbi:MAG TPA: sugar phosphate isomerase/epimerase family protein [Thermomicrobiales bacterium]|nr:sugar phosphate isomerase/epimerase family protein [Thermomicrobiales bacterium]